MEIDDVTGIIVDAAVKIHRDLGSSLFESVYEVALASVLERRGLRVVRQQQLGFSYEGIEFEHAFRADLAGFPVGLLLNFGAGMMKEGIKRLVNDLPPSAASPLRVNRPSP